MPFLVRCVGDEQGLGDDPVVFPYLEVCCVYCYEGVSIFESALLEIFHGDIQILAKLRDRGLGVTGPAQRFHHLLDLPGGYAIHHHFRHSGDESCLTS